jgi:hypothetical protein
VRTLQYTQPLAKCVLPALEETHLVLKIADQPGEVLQVLHVRDEEAVGLAHVIEILFETSTARPAKDAVVQRHFDVAVRHLPLFVLVVLSIATVDGRGSVGHGGGICDGRFWSHNGWSCIDVHGGGGRGRGRGICDGAASATFCTLGHGGKGGDSVVVLLLRLV